MKLSQYSIKVFDKYILYIITNVIIFNIIFNIQPND